MFLFHHTVVCDRIRARNTMASATVQTPVLPSGLAVPGARPAPRTVLRLVGELRGTSRSSSCPEGTRFVLDLDAKMAAGPLSGGQAVGFGQITLGRDGSVRLVGSHTMESAGETVSLSLYGVLTASTDECVDGVGFPDRDYPLSGSGLIHAQGESVASLDGTVAAVRGWVNFESGEVEIEALA